MWPGEGKHHLQSSETVYGPGICSGVKLLRALWSLAVCNSLLAPCCCLMSRNKERFYWEEKESQQWIISYWTLSTADELNISDLVQTGSFYLGPLMMFPINRKIQVRPNLSTFQVDFDLGWSYVVSVASTGLFSLLVLLNVVDTIW